MTTENSTTTKGFVIAGVRVLSAVRFSDGTVKTVAASGRMRIASPMTAGTFITEEEA